MSKFDLVLTEDELKIFKKFLNSDTAFLTKEEFTALRKHKLLTGVLGGFSDYFDLPPDGICELLDFGKRYRRYFKDITSKERRDNRRYIRSETRSWIALSISFIALIFSAIALFRS